MAEEDDNNKSEAIGITPGFEKGVCSICGGECEVRIVFGAGRVAKICKDCAAGSGLSVEELLEKHGLAVESG